VTKHRPEFSEVQRTDTPDAEALLDIVNRWGLIYAVKRTKSILDALVNNGKLIRQTRYIVREGKRKAAYRYTLPPKV